MPQGRGYWFNPKHNISLEVSRHEIDIKNKNFQDKIKISPHAVEAMEELNTVKDENEIKLLAVRTGLIRIRDWQKFLSIQFFAKGNKVIDTLFPLIELIDAFENKKTSGMSKEERNLAMDLANSWKLRIENLASGNVEQITPDEFVKRHSEDGFMESKIEEHKRPINEISISPGELERVEHLLDKHGFFIEEKNGLVDLLFESLKSNKNVSVIDEDLAFSRVWKMANDGKHSFVIISAFRDGNTMETNIARSKVLEQVIKKLGYGFNKVSGFWTQLNKKDSKDDEKIEIPEPTYEDSFFVSKSIPENETEDGAEGTTVSKMIKDFTGLIGGEPEMDSKVPTLEEVLSGNFGFNQDAIAIKPDPQDTAIHLMGRDGGSFPLGEVEFFKDIRAEIKKLPQDILEKLKSKAGGISFTDLKTKKGKTPRSFRAGSLKTGDE